MAWGWGEAAVVSSVTFPLGAIIMQVINKFLPSRNGKGACAPGFCPDPKVVSSLTELKTQMKTNTEAVKGLDKKIEDKTDAIHEKVNGVGLNVAKICGFLKIAD